MKRIAIELVQAWRDFYQYGDYSAIAEQCGAEPYEIQRILKINKHPKASEDVFQAIKKFYDERAKDLQQQKVFAKSLNAA